MAYKNKTAETNADVTAFIHTFVQQEAKKDDSFRLIEWLSAWSGYPPRMWGPTIIGFGQYHYRYASGHEGVAPILGFSPRKAAFSLYAYTAIDEHRYLLDGLGKFTMGKCCIYFKKLSDLHLPALEKMCRTTLAYMREHYDCSDPDTSSGRT